METGLTKLQADFEFTVLCLSLEQLGTGCSSVLICLPTTGDPGFSPQSAGRKKKKVDPDQVAEITAQVSAIHLG